MATKPASAPANPQAALIIDRSVKSIAAALASVTKATSELGGLVEQTAALSQSIEDKNAELAALTAHVDTSAREAAAELRLRVTEDRGAVLKTLLSENGLAEIKAADLAALRQQVSDLLAKDDADLRSAVNAAVASTKRDADAAAALKEADNKVSAAQKDATITSLTDRVTFLTAQVAQLQGQIDSERQTRVTIAQAEAQKQGVVVQTGKQ